MKTKLHFFLLALILLTVAYLAITPLTFYTSDTGLRLVQINALIEQESFSLAIPYPTDIDPNFEHVPYYYAYALLNGDLFLNISPFFPIISAWFYELLGAIGLIILPVAGALLTAFAVFKLARLCDLPHAAWLAWLTVFATPLVMYALQLWDHSLGTGLGVWGIYWLASGLLQERRAELIGGGVMLAFSFGQRPEMYTFVIAAGLAFVIVSWPRWQTAVSVIIGGMLGAIPVWGLQTVWVGHPLGMAFAPHLLGYGVPDYPISSSLGTPLTPALRIGRFLLHIERGDPFTFLAALLLLISLVLVIFSLPLPIYLRPALLWAAGVMGVVATRIWAGLGFELNVLGLLSTFPLIPLALCYVNNTNEKHYKVYQLAFLTTFIFVMLMLALWPAFGGDQWGQRYLLPAYPLLLFTAAFAYHHYQNNLPKLMQQPLQRVTLLLVVASIAFQLVGVRRLFVIQAEQLQVRNAVAEQPMETIFTNHIFSVFLSSVDDKQFFFVLDDEMLPQMIERSHAAGVQTIGILPYPGEELEVPTETESLIIEQISPLSFELIEK